MTLHRIQGQFLQVMSVIFSNQYHGRGASQSTAFLLRSHAE